MNQPYDEIMELERIVARWIGRALAVICIVLVAFWIGGGI